MILPGDNLKRQINQMTMDRISVGAINILKGPSLKIKDPTRYTNPMINQHSRIH
jgi:hypothetical protein